MTDSIIDLSKPTGYFEVAVFHYEDGTYSVDADRGHGRLTVYTASSEDKALGVAEYLESTGRIRWCGPEKEEFATNEGEPFAGSIWHWDCGCAAAPKGPEEQDRA